MRKLVFILMLLTHTIANFGQTQRCYPVHGDEGIIDVILPYLIKYKLPGIGVAVITNYDDISVGVVGTRKINGDEAIDVNNIWHIGSCAKAMCATVVGTFVEEGIIEWDTKIEEVFPNISKKFTNELGSVTIKMLLAHQSGLVRNLDYDSLSEFDTKEQRLQALIKAGTKDSMFQKPAQYSNLGYAIVGAIIEKISNKTYEEVIRERLFDPLGMKSATFVGDKTDYTIPGSHNAQGQSMEFSNTYDSDPVVLRPAGCIRFTLNDWALFVREHLKGEQGKSNFLKPETYEALHKSNYALGWGVVNRPWGGGKVLCHTGSNGYNYSNLWLAPLKGFAVLICINQGDTFKVTDEIAGDLINYIKEKEDIVE